MADSDEAHHLLAAARKDWNALGGMADPDVFADEIRDGDTVQVTLDHSRLTFHAPPHEGAKPEKAATGKKG